MTAFEPSLYFRSPSLNPAGRPHMGQRSRCRASKAGHMSAIDPLVRILLPLLNSRGRPHKTLAVAPRRPASLQSSAACPSDTPLRRKSSAYEVSQSTVQRGSSAILFQALTLNCGNLRRRWQEKGTSPQGEADSSDAPPRDGAARSSVETAVRAVERRGGVIRQAWRINRVTGRNSP